MSHNLVSKKTGKKQMKIGYARVSTIDQNLDSQISALKNAGCDEIQIEKASGGKRCRPILNEVLEKLQEGDTLAVLKLSRLGRSLPDVLGITKEIENKGANLAVLTQNIDTRTPESKLFFHIVAAFDEFQRDMIRENTRMGLIEARKKGRNGGRRRKVGKREKSLLEALIRDKKNFPTIADVIRSSDISKATFYRYFSPEEIWSLRNNKLSTACE